MKTLLTISLFILASSLSISAKWGPSPLNSLVGLSDCIVIAEFISETDRKVEDQRIDQQAKLKVISTIKGKIAKEIVISGYEDPRLCKAQFIFPKISGGRYLLFLKKIEGGYAVVNGAFGALAITDNQVMWYTDAFKMQTMRDRKMTPIDEAIKAIKKS